MDNGHVATNGGDIQISNYNTQNIESEMETMNGHEENPDIELQSDIKKSDDDLTKSDVNQKKSDMNIIKQDSKETVDSSNDTVMDTKSVTECEGDDEGDVKKHHDKSNNTIIDNNQNNDVVIKSDTTDALSVMSVQNDDQTERCVDKKQDSNQTVGTAVEPDEDGNKKDPTHYTTETVTIEGSTTSVTDDSDEQVITTTVSDEAAAQDDMENEKVKNLNDDDSHPSEEEKTESTCPTENIQTIKEEIGTTTLDKHVNTQTPERPIDIGQAPEEHEDVQICEEQVDNQNMEEEMATKGGFPEEQPTNELVEKNEILTETTKGVHLATTREKDDVQPTEKIEDTQISKNQAPMPNRVIEEAEAVEESHSRDKNDEIEENDQEEPCVPNKYDESNDISKKETSRKVDIAENHDQIVIQNTDNVLNEVINENEDVEKGCANSENEEKQSQSAEDVQSTSADESVKESNPPNDDDNSIASQESSEKHDQIEVSTCNKDNKEQLDSQYNGKETVTENNEVINEKDHSSISSSHNADKTENINLDEQNIEGQSDTHIIEEQEDSQSLKPVHTQTPDRKDTEQNKAHIKEDVSVRDVENNTNSEICDTNNVTDNKSVNSDPNVMTIDTKTNQHSDSYDTQHDCVKDESADMNTEQSKQQVAENGDKGSDNKRKISLVEDTTNEGLPETQILSINPTEEEEEVADVKDHFESESDQQVNIDAGVAKHDNIATNLENEVIQNDEEYKESKKNSKESDKNSVGRKKSTSSNNDNNDPECKNEKSSSSSSSIFLDSDSHKSNKHILKPIAKQKDSCKKSAKSAKNNNIPNATNDTSLKSNAKCSKKEHVELHEQNLNKESKQKENRHLSKSANPKFRSSRRESDSDHENKSKQKHNRHSKSAHPKVRTNSQDRTESKHQIQSNEKKNKHKARSADPRVRSNSAHSFERPATVDNHQRSRKSRSSRGKEKDTEMEQTPTGSPPASRKRVKELSRPRQYPSNVWISTNGPRVLWGTQETLWPMREEALHASATPRLEALAEPKRCFQTGDRINRDQYYYSAGRPSAVWKVNPSALQGDATPRVVDLAKPKEAPPPHKEPAFVFSCGRTSPIWEISESAKKTGPTERTVQLAEVKPLPAEYQYCRDTSFSVDPKALKAATTPYIEALSAPRKRHEGQYRETWEVSPAAKKAQPTSRMTELARPKQCSDAYQMDRRLAGMTVSAGAKKAEPTPRINELAVPIVRQKMDAVLYDHTVFNVKPFALKATCTARTEELAQPIIRS